MADRAICEKKLTGKALKDIVGEEFETHRKRIWEYFGFSVTKDKHNACFSVDWTIKNKKGEIVAFEEDKGHYLDSCFMERALTGFAKTINSYVKNDTKIPHLLIHSFTKYSKFEEKKLEDIETRKEFREILELGLNDMYRAYYPNQKDYTFWDYQRGAWQKNEGIRIDHILASPIAADQITNLTIDKEERDKDKPSDHVPIIAEINI